MPPPSMMAAASRPRPGAAKPLVPKYGMGMAFWMAGEPGSAVMVKVNAPSAIVAGTSRFGISAASNRLRAIG